MYRPISTDTKLQSPARTGWILLVAAIMLSATIFSSNISRAAGLPDPGAALPDPDFSRHSGTQDWTGFFLGASLGYGFGDMSATGTSGDFHYDADGTFASLYFGHDWQFGNYVLGIEGEFGGGDVSGSDASAASSQSAELNWLNAIRARAGFLLGPALLIYATGGYAWADLDLSGTGAGAFNISGSFSGYQVGGGAEYRFGPSWALRVDYVFTDLDDETISAGGVSNNFDPEFHLVRAGLTMRF